jgi:cytochrome c-type biogenesis protein CcmE
MAPSRKLAIGALIVTGMTVYLAYLGAASSWQYYLTVDECLGDLNHLGQARIRVSGKIVPHSLEIAENRKHAQFALEGTAGDLKVTCAGSLPDNLAERLDVVVEGRLDKSGILRGEKVLTRCASKYKSRDDSGGSSRDLTVGTRGGI